MTAVDERQVMTARDHALRVAVLTAVSELAARELKKARAEAEGLFAGLREDGQSQQKVLLPGGEEVGLISIKAGAVVTETDEDALLAWVREHCPGELEECIDGTALLNLDVIELVRAVFPGLVKVRVRDSARKKLIAEAAESGGWVADCVTGEKGRVADVEGHPPTGAFSYRPGPGTTERVVAGWLSGRLAVPGLNGPLALAAGSDDR